MKEIRIGRVVFGSLVTLLVVGALLPAVASADTKVALAITGSGTVKETTDAGKVNCFKAWNAADHSCGAPSWPGWWGVTLTATAASGWHFVRWDNPDGGLGCSDEKATCSFTSSATHYDGTLTAVFEGNDSDGDGVHVPGDCNDNDRSIHPGATDVPGNGVDEDCDGHDASDFDADNDGFDRQAGGAKPPYDCDDTNPNVHPGAREIPDNDVDEDCDGRKAVNLDRDADGYSRNEPGASAPFDCDDTNPRIHPGAEDVPDNGIDEDCDGRQAVNLDRDDDGYRRNEPGGKPPFDCDDANLRINPGAVDVPDNGVDENCDGRDAIRLDRDGDGYDRAEPGAKAPFDCDDTNASIHPSALDVPQNGVDEDCDGPDADYPTIASEVRYSTRRKGGWAQISSLSVLRPPDGARVGVRCRGKGCTFKRRSQVAAPGTSELSFAADLRKAKLAQGATVEVWITRSGMRGKVVRLKVGRGGRVSALALCVEPGAARAGACPAG